ncbi:tyrosine-type recombinase/integrase [Streptomyces sp. NPDC001455]|uniref:tyrosine-type recombinase/integrase n=1 Tax=unclassified Streptomyces TaxID=2593676 RepID=UPI00331DF012
MEHVFVAERSIFPLTGLKRWVVADTATYTLHAPACAFLQGLRNKGRSPNTERVYAGRLALYLNHCHARGVDWAAPSFLALSQLQQHLITEPLPPRSRRTRAWAPPRYRSRGTANAVMIVVAEFLRFSALHGLVAPATVSLLSQPKFLRFAPPGYDTGENNQWRHIQAAAFRFQITEPGYEDLTPEQIRHMIGQVPRARDKFLIALLAATGLRIGEALGLHQQDLHFLASSQMLGCTLTGPHLHVHRRLDNPNHALAKSPRSRSIPTTPELVALYTDYQHERDRVPEAAHHPMVFVNLFRPPLGRAMSYPNTKQAFERWARTAGHPARPHILRHSAATRWLRDGVDRDVVQRLMGHASPLSLQRYRHVDDTELRAAVDHLQALKEQP